MSLLGNASNILTVGSSVFQVASIANGLIQGFINGEIDSPEDFFNVLFGGGTDAANQEINAKLDDILDGIDELSSQITVLGNELKQLIEDQTDLVIGVDVAQIMGSVASERAQLSSFDPLAEPGEPSYVAPEDLAAYFRGFTERSDELLQQMAAVADTILTRTSTYRPSVELTLSTVQSLTFALEFRMQVASRFERGELAADRLTDGLQNALIAYDKAELLLRNLGPTIVTMDRQTVTSSDFDSGGPFRVDMDGNGTLDTVNFTYVYYDTSSTNSSLGNDFFYFSNERSPAEAFAENTLLTAPPVAGSFKENYKIVTRNLDLSYDALIVDHIIRPGPELFPVGFESSPNMDRLVNGPPLSAEDVFDDLPVIKSGFQSAAYYESLRKLGVTLGYDPFEVLTSFGGIPQVLREMTGGIEDRSPDANGNVVGTAGRDLLAGDGADNEIVGLGENDTILGRGGRDTLDGGQGDDLVRGGGGNDRLDGGADGSDALLGEDGEDTIFGRGGNDLLIGGAGADQLYGGIGDDVLSGGEGDDVLDGSDARGGGLASDSDTLFGGAGNDLLIYSQANTGGTKLFEIDGGADTDTFVAQSALGAGLFFRHVDLVAGEFRLVLDGSLGGTLANIENVSVGNNISVLGDGGANVITGLSATEGNDFRGGGGGDTIRGGGGDDTMEGGAGDDVIEGGDGANDRAVFGGALAGYMLSGIPGGAITVQDVDLSDGDDGQDLVTGTELFEFADGVRPVTLLREGQAGVVGGGDDDLVVGGITDDLLLGGAGDDALFGGDGNDTLDGSDGTGMFLDFNADTLRGGAGDDVLVYSMETTGADAIFDMDGGIGTDTFRAASATGFGLLSRHVDLVAGEFRVEVGGPLRGTFSDIENVEADSTISVLGDGKANVITGLSATAANDFRGGGGDDTIRGGGGDDTMEGGAGDDVIEGGDGANDRAVFGGAFAGYAVSVTPDGTITVRDVDPSDGDDGEDRVTGTELLEFTDGEKSVASLIGKSIAETGTLALTHAAMTVTLQRSYENPVVVAFVATETGAQPVNVRVSGLTGDALTLRLQEPNHLDGFHDPETVNYLVVEAGTWVLPDGTVLEAGTLASDRLSTQGFEDVAFDAAFDAAPVVLSQVQTSNGGDFVTTRKRGVDADGFQLTMQEEEALNGGGHVTESIGWVALEAGGGTAGAVSWLAGSTGGVTDATATVGLGPGFAGGANVVAGVSSLNGADPAWARGGGSTATSFDVSVEEDTSRDAETAHTAETVDWFAFDRAGTLAAAPIREVAETGTLSVNHVPQTVTLQRSYENPVVVAFVASEAGADPVNVRVDAVTGDALTLRLQEPNHLDGLHGRETVNYLVVEAGTWVLPDGTLLEAGTLASDRLSTQGFESVAFDSQFDAAPVILSQVQSANGGDFVTTRKQGVDADGFRLTMQEEEALNGGRHAVETLGWVALEAGGGMAGEVSWLAGRAGGVTEATATVDLGAGFAGAANLLAGVSSLNGADPAWARGSASTAASFDVSVEEDTSRDAETAHTAETVDWFAFDRAGVIGAYDDDLFV
jgi:hypothetical protein